MAENKEDIKEKVIDKSKEVKQDVVNETSKVKEDIKPKIEKVTKEIKEETKKIVCKIHEVTKDKLIVNFRGFRLGLENNFNKQKNDNVEIEYKDNENGFEIINHK